MCIYSHQVVLNISEICYQLGISTAIVSPGSRVAPIMLAFTRHPHFKIYTISDERSAGFIGLGIAQQKNKPVILCSTSGTAALNYAPAVAEAFYQQVSLIVLTADRPPEWIDQEDGQAIRQENIYGGNCKKYFSLPCDYNHPDSRWYIYRTISEAVNMSLSDLKGPVHINIPIREPFYPTEETYLVPKKKIKIIKEIKSNYRLSRKHINYLQKKISSYKKILVLCGQQEQPSKSLLHQLNKSLYPIIADIIANGHYIKEAIRYQDAFLKNISNKRAKILQPELLISLGKSIISKNLKLFLRKYPPKVHWHIQIAGQAADTFQSLNHVIRVTPKYFFKKVVNSSIDIKSSNFYKKELLSYDKKIQILNKNFFIKEDFSELEVVKEALELIPENWFLHLANSMAVRYANLMNNIKSKNVSVFSNRGTGGIDGCTSTFIGHALASSKEHLFITGDMAFFYDRNAFWNQYIGENIKILLLNNQGGVIFKLIDGPNKLAEVDKYFVTEQKCEAKLLAKEYGLSYYQASDRKTFKKKLIDLFKLESAGILEIKTEINRNVNVFQNYKQAIKNLFR